MMEQSKILRLLTKNKKIKAATLIELILVIGIMVIISAGIILNTNLYSNYVEKIELKNLVIAINQVRNIAISTRTVTTLKFNIKENSYYCEEHNIEKVNLKKLELLSINTENESFTFTKSGSPSHTGSGTLFLKGNNYGKLKITVEPIIGNVGLVEVSNNE